VSRLRVFAAAGAVLLSIAAAQDVSPQGLVFDHWLRDAFFGGVRPTNSSSNWDIPASANSNHGGVPVSAKTARLGSPVDLGDALRAYEIDEPFLLIIGFWDQPGGEPARFVRFISPVVSAEQWRKLWGPVTFADLQRLDALIKDTGPTIEEIRRRVLLVKNSPPFSDAVIQLNPKIDDRGPRRLQCSLRFHDVFTQLAPEANPTPQQRPSLFGTEYPEPPAAKGRSSGQD
jgi:hypothetical protein